MHTSPTLEGCSSHSRTPPPFEPPNRQDLFTQQSRSIDIWRIEGGALDLLLHQERSSFPPHSLEGPLLYCFFGNSSCRFGSYKFVFDCLTAYLYSGASN